MGSVDAARSGHWRDMGRTRSYMQRLRRLEVPLSSGLISAANPSVRIHKYQNTKLVGENAPANTQAGALYTLYVHDASSSKPAVTGSPDLLIGAVHQGIGSADQIVNVLQLVTHYGLSKQFKYFNPLPDQIGTSLQAYCESYIGLDCVGFILGFARDVKKSAIGYAGSYGTATFKAYAAAPPAAESVVVWDDGDMSHVALIDEARALAGGATWIHVCESIGEGAPMKGLHEDEGSLTPDKSAPNHFFFDRKDLTIAKTRNRVMVVRLP